MTRPVRLQLSRARGFDLQALSLATNGLPAVAVTRGPGKRWGNPYKTGDLDPVTYEPMTASGAVFWFKADLDPLVSAEADTDRSAIRFALAGRNLACWCKLGSPCHADVLLEIANPTICERVEP